MEAASKIKEPVPSIEVLGEIESFMDGDQREVVRRQIESQVKAYRFNNDREFERDMRRIATYVSDDVLTTWMDTAHEARDLEKLWFARAATTFLSCGEPEIKERLIDVAVDTALTIKSDQTKAYALNAIESHIRDRHVDRIFDQSARLTERTGSSSSNDPLYGSPRMAALASLAPHLVGAKVFEALEIIKSSEGGSARTYAMIACYRRLEQPARDRILPEILELVYKDVDKDWLLSEPVPWIEGAERTRAFKEFLCRSTWLSAIVEYKLGWIAKMVPHLKATEVKEATQHALDIAPEVRLNIEFLWASLADLAPYFDEEQLEAAIRMVSSSNQNGITYSYGRLRSDALAALAIRKGGEERESLLAEALSVAKATGSSDINTKLEALACVAPFADNRNDILWEIQEGLVYHLEQLRTKDRSELLALCSRHRIFAEAVVSPSLLAEIARTTVEVFSDWKWLRSTRNYQNVPNKLLTY